MCGLISNCYIIFAVIFVSFSAQWFFLVFLPIDRALSGATIPDQSGSGSNGNEGVLYISQRSSIIGNLPSDCSVSYPGYSLGRSYPSAEVQSVYSTAPADWAIHKVNVKTVLFQIIQFSTSTQFRCQKSFISINLV